MRAKNSIPHCPLLNPGYAVEDTWGSIRLNYILNDYNLFLMSMILAAGCIGFFPFNFPKAKVFMGDVGSILLGFVFASFVVRLSTSINVFLCLIMFLCTFYADAVITIFYRWRRGENLMQAHRVAFSILFVISYSMIKKIKPKIAVQGRGPGPAHIYKAAWI